MRSTKFDGICRGMEVPGMVFGMNTRQCRRQQRNDNQNVVEQLHELNRPL